MALNNMLKEPRRELTETLVGAIVVGAFIVGDCFFSYWSVGDYRPKTAQDAPLALAYIGMFLIGAFLVVLTLGLGIFTHYVGESLCDRLEDVGIQLRPQNRNRR